MTIAYTITMNSMMYVTGRLTSKTAKEEKERGEDKPQRCPQNVFMEDSRYENGR
jgi:hypothetical protein